MRYVIVGAGLAGAKAAETLRAEGFDGEVVLLGQEDALPYERPPLSKDYLLGKAAAEKAYVFEEQWYAEHDVELRRGARVTAVDRAAHEVEVEGQGRLGYDKLLLATGSRARTLGLAGEDANGVHHLRDLPDSTALLAALTAGGRVVVVGAGWIGLEAAAAAREHGCEVTVVEPAPSPLNGPLGSELGGWFGEVHRAHGVDLRLGVQVDGLAVEDGRVTGVVAGGETLPADAVLIAVGARPNVEALGFELDDTGGIPVDGSLRTEDPDVYAAGDIASIPTPAYGRRIRVEHWACALNSGPAAARAMLGQDVTYDELPYFFTDQYDVGMEFAGWFPPGGYDRVTRRGDGDAFHVLWTADGRVVAGMHVNQWDDGIEPAKRLIRSGERVDPESVQLA